MKRLVSVCLLGMVLIGCSAQKSSTVASTKSVESKPATISTQDQTELFEVHHDGRIYFFYDQALYSDFLATHHVNYQQSRIAAGPNGETLVFALTGKDKKKLTGIPSVQIYDGYVPLFTPFYGETVKEGRIYVFNDHKLMKSFREMGEAAYRLTVIGGGEGGKTLVYVLTKAEKKKRPEKMMAQYKLRHNGV